MGDGARRVLGRPRVGSSGEGLPRGPAGLWGRGRGRSHEGRGHPSPRPASAPGSGFETLSSSFPGLAWGVAKEPPRSGRIKGWGGGGKNPSHPTPSPDLKRICFPNAVWGRAAARPARNPAPSGTSEPARRHSPGSTAPSPEDGPDPQDSDKPRTFPLGGRGPRVALGAGGGGVGEGRPTLSLRP